MEEKKFCKFCGEEIDKSSIVCPKCGRQLQIVKNVDEKEKIELPNNKDNQIKFYEKQWFMWLMLVFFAPVGIFLMWKFNNNLKQKTKIILSIVFGIIFLITMFGGDKDADYEKIVWDDIELKDKLPKPEKLIGDVTINDVDWLSLDITNISKKEYKDYIEKCRDKGYTIDLEYEPWDDSYEAFDKKGYSLRIHYYDYNEKMSIDLESPKQDTMKEIEWPTNSLVATLPKPKSTFGDIILNNSEDFKVYIGNMTISDYNEYVKSCENKGFINDYNKNDKSYSATNNDGYKLHLRYAGANVIEISLDAPKKEEINSTQDKSNTGTNTETNANSNTDIRNDFKKAMDDYEKFMDEYVAFMKKYKNSNGTDMSLLTDYAKYMEKYSEMLSSFEKWNDKDLNTEETKYYLEVQTRVNKKLIDASVQ